MGIYCKISVASVDFKEHYAKSVMEDMHVHGHSIVLFSRCRKAEEKNIVKEPLEHYKQTCTRNHGDTGMEKSCRAQPQQETLIRGGAIGIKEGRGGRPRAREIMGAGTNELSEAKKRQKDRLFFFVFVVSLVFFKLPAKKHNRSR